MDSSLWKKHTYLLSIVILSIFCLGGAKLLNIDDLFVSFYSINSEGINSAFLSFFGVMFGFLLAALSLLLTSSKSALFTELLNEHGRYHNDIVTYFVAGILSSFAVVLLSLLSIIFAPNHELALNGQFYEGAAYLTFYLAGFAFLNLITLLFLFFQLIRR